MFAVYAKPSKKLIEHLMEAGTVAECLMLNGRAHSAVSVLADRFEIDDVKLVSSIAFLCASHDIGKAHPGFQKCLAMMGASDAKENLSVMLDSGMIVEQDQTVRHECYSMEIMQRYFSEKGFSKDAANEFSTVIAYHHQGKAGKSIVEPVLRYEQSGERWREWEKVQNELLSQIWERWQFSKEMENVVDADGMNGFMYFVLSVMVVSDWIVSGSLWQEYLNRYGTIEESANAFICENGLKYEPMQEKYPDLKWGDVFTFSMNALQKKIKDMLSDYADLTIVEYPCGYGKTESAMLASYLLGKKKSGFVFAAPTITTAKALAERLQGIVSKVDAGFVLPEFDSSMFWREDDMNRIKPELWTSKARHQLLYHSAVGTVDQVLKAVLQFRYSCVGFMGILDKVVVIDEIHAYDAYMLKELVTLVQYCKFFKVPVVCLSATLPTMTKEKLFRAAGVRGAVSISNVYPIVSVVRNGRLLQEKTECEGVTMPVRTVCTKSVESEMVASAVGMKEGCMALIVPRVDDAFALYHRLQLVLSEDELMLYQGRNSVKQKNVRIEKLLRLCGKDRSERPKKFVVVATSIIEQSLDADFDYMITTLAPIDLLIQRMGRVWRHSDAGTVRANEKIENPFTVVIPEKYAGLSWIYDESILRKSEKILLNTQSIDTVNDVRGMIDKVYDVELSDDIVKELNANRYCLSVPGKDVNVTLEKNDKTMHGFDRLEPLTREQAYPTSSIAILDELKDEYTHAEMVKIMNENVIGNVGEYLFGKYFQPMTTKIKWFNGIAVFVGKNGCVDGKERQMLLTDDGLEFIRDG